MIKFEKNKTMKNQSTNNTISKVVLIAFVSILFVLILAAILAPDYVPLENRTIEDKKEYFSELIEVEIDQKHPNLTVEDIQDVSYKTIKEIRTGQPNVYNEYKRYSLNVIANQVLSDEELSRQLKSILLDFMTKNTDAKAVVLKVFVNDEKYSNIRAIYAPNGNWLDSSKEDVTFYDYKFVIK